MFLVLAAGSSGHYRVDANGDVYVARYWARGDDGLADPGFSFGPRETFWVRHGTMERLTVEQHRDLAQAELAWALACDDVHGGLSLDDARAQLALAR